MVGVGSLVGRVLKEQVAARARESHYQAFKPQIHTGRILGARGLVSDSFIRYGEGCCSQGFILFSASKLSTTF